MTRFRTVIAPLALAAGLAGTLGACETTNSGPNYQQGYQRAPAYPATYAPGYQQASGYQAGYAQSGRVVSVRDVAIGNQRSGVSDGTLIGGGVGMAGGAAVGAAVSKSVGGAVVGGVLGGIMGGVAGTAIDRNRSVKGIEVVVEKDDGQTVAIAQRDDGDVQMGDRVQIVYDRNGVAKAVRENYGYRRD